MIPASPGSVPTGPNVASPAQAWTVLAGFSGQISLGAAAFIATGGYTTALILVHTGLLGAGLLALPLAVPLLRLRGDYFARRRPYRGRDGERPRPRRVPAGPP